MGMLLTVVRALIREKDAARHDLERKLLAVQRERDRLRRDVDFLVYWQRKDRIRIQELQEHLDHSCRALSRALEKHGTPKQLIRITPSNRDLTEARQAIIGGFIEKIEVDLRAVPADLKTTPS